MIVFFYDPFRFWLFRPVEFTAIICVCSDVQFISECAPDVFRQPFRVIFRFYAVLLKEPGNLPARMKFFVQVKNHFYPVFFFRFRNQYLLFRIRLISQRQKPAIPQAAFRAVKHDPGHTFGSHVSF